MSLLCATVDTPVTQSGRVVSPGYTEDAAAVATATASTQPEQQEQQQTTQPLADNLQVCVDKQKLI